jgi:Common central domain of tyrosinase/Polyphenol oxidase middle domain
MAEMDRRDFLLAALSGLGGLGLAGCADIPGMVAPAGRRAAVDQTAPAQIACLNVRTRKNIYCLSASHPDVVGYCTAVSVMKARPSSDPTSWEAQRAIHWTTVISPPTSIFDKCEHGTAFFLSWHRMYLYWFERIARAACGNSSWALPYWGYSPTGARNLPSPFRVPAGSGNPLYDGTRNANSNNGVNMSASLVDPGLALLELAFYNFQGQLESTPHNGVHTPGVQGNMGTVPTAALDPIFYLHHCQIDRLWGVWLAQGGGRANPTDSPWLNNVYQFYNESGAVVNMTGAQIVNTANQLCYQYASPKCVAVAEPDVEATQIFMLDSRSAAVADSIGTRPPRVSTYTLADEQVGVKLGGTPVTVSVPIPAATQDELRAFADAREGNRFSLLLQDIVLARDPVLYYEVYVNLPGDGKDAQYTSPNYAGNLTFFDLTMPSAHQMSGGLAQQINLTRVYAYQRSRGEWKDEAVQVTFVPRGGSEGDDPAKLVADVQATIGRITLQLR